MTPQELISLAKRVRGERQRFAFNRVIDINALCNGAIEIAASVELLAELPCQECERRKADTRERVARFRSRQRERS